MKKLLKPILLAIAIGIPLSALAGNLPEVLAATAAANGWIIGGVFIGLLVYTVLNAAVWGDVLAGLGHHPGRRKVTSLWIRAEAMKWLPGGIWGYASRVVKAPEIGVAKSVAGASLVAELLLTIGAWTTLAAVGLLLAGPSLLADLELPHLPLTPAMVIGTIVIAILALPVLLRFRAPLCRAVAARLAPLREKRWSVRPLLRAFGSYLLLCGFHAFLLQVLVFAIRPGTADWSFFASADGIAWLAGFFAIGVPGGIGVREAGLAWFLSQAMTLPEAIAVAVLWRALQIAAELTSFGIASAARCQARTPLSLDACQHTL